MKIITDKNRIKEALEKGVEKIYPSKEALEKVLSSGKRIRLYCGYDPTAPSLHLGHAITLRKLAQFQRLGHEVIMLIGDFTAMIGDPTDKTATRKRLTNEEIKRNLKNYKQQASKILKFSGKNPAKILFNSKWHNKLNQTKLIELAFNFTAQQMMVREMFRKRIEEDKPIYLPELLYPLAQAYDSVTMDVDLEIGGNDQTFNMLCGRDLMKVFKNKEKFVLATKLLVDPTGKKMGKTEGNMINLDDKPSDMYGKVMSWPDSLIIPGFKLCTDLSIDKIKNPRDAKAQLAREIVTIYHGKIAASDAEGEFNRIFREGQKPTHLPEIHNPEIKYDTISSTSSVVVHAGLAPSRSAADRLIEQGALDIEIDGQVIKKYRKKEIMPKKRMILRFGKRKFRKLI